MKLDDFISLNHIIPIHEQAKAVAACLESIFVFRLIPIAEEFAGGCVTAGREIVPSSALGPIMIDANIYTATGRAGSMAASVRMVFPRV